jgi:hypothetical protein
MISRGNEASRRLYERVPQGVAKCRLVRQCASDF